MKISKEVIFTLIKERWKFYFIGYIIGYAFPLIYDGVPNALFLIPIKLSGFVFALLLGTPFYYGYKKILVFEGAFRLLKYGVLVLVITILFYIFQRVLLNYGIDITPFLGFPKT